MTERGHVINCSLSHVLLHNFIHSQAFSQQTFREPGAALGVEAPAGSEQAPALKGCTIERMGQGTRDTDPHQNSV